MLDIEDATSISPSFTLPYTLVEAKIRLKECCGMVDAFVKCSPGLLVPSHSVCDCSWAADSLPATEMLELDVRWYTVVYIPDVYSRPNLQSPRQEHLKNCDFFKVLKKF